MVRKKNNAGRPENEIRILEEHCLSLRRMEGA